MRQDLGDIWRFHPEHWIVIPTNIGWNKNGANVMGAGLAKEAAKRYPPLPGSYGALCKALRSETPTMPNHLLKLILFPVKPLAELPWLSWKQDASLRLIERSTKELAALESLGPGPIYVPVVGCGNGKLKPEDVTPILRKYLDDRFVLVRQK